LHTPARAANDYVSVGPRVTPTGARALCRRFAGSVLAPLRADAREAFDP